MISSKLMADESFNEVRKVIISYLDGLGKGYENEYVDDLLNYINKELYIENLRGENYINLIKIIEEKKYEYDYYVDLLKKKFPFL